MPHLAVRDTVDVRVVGDEAQHSNSSLREYVVSQANELDEIIVKIKFFLSKVALVIIQQL
jgi:hypothetical protein